jgi:uncharacterized ion transporter superfamily protein YfcC
MKRSKMKTLVWVVAMAAVLCWVVPAMAAEVSQGKCKEYNKQTKVITIEEYNLNFSKANPYGEPTGEMNAYDVSNAQIGIPPQPGDVLRIAYDVKGTKREALKVMNVSKQDLRKK